MIETKAIDDSVKNLLLTVRNQAEKYKLLFVELELLRDTIVNDITELRDISDKYEDKFNNEVIDLEIRYDNSIQSIEEKISQVKQLEIDYEKIKQHKNELEKLIEKFETESNEFTQAFVDFRFETEKNSR